MDGVELLGPLDGSGYRHPPHLVRRGDGQVLQLTPLLGAVLAGIDGHRDAGAIAEHVAAHHGRALHPDDIAQLVDSKLRPLGLVRSVDGSPVAIRRANPLLGLRGRIQLTGPQRTHAVTGPFLWLFRPAVVAVVVAAFASFAAWVLLRHGLGAAVDEAIADPALLLVLIALVLASGAFHEIGHATACRYGGARPRAMGAAVYLVWPAFYTDVTDSYRLDRRGRLRVDLGGLYFNAVFTLATGAAWLATGLEALLVLVPVQVLQMARQLVPIVRFDGYHILADLVGVPDLYARIRPTLARVLPGQRAVPSPLTRRAQVIVVGWVAVVVPFLAVSFGLLLWSLPGIVVGSVHSLRAQHALFTDNVSAGRIAAALLGVVAMATVAFLPASAGYLTARLARRSGTRFWRATEGHPRVRAATLSALVLALVAAAGPGLSPSNPERGGELAGAVAGGDEVTELALGPAEPIALDPGLRALRPPESLAEPAVEPAGAAPVAPSPAAAPAPVPAPVVATDVPLPVVRPAWPFSFPPPDPAGTGDNQVVAVNTVDRATRVELATSLQWLVDQPMETRNEAWALAECIDCRTVAVAFQVVAASGSVDVAAPRNIAVAANESCDTCRTTAIAVQLAVTLAEQPPADVRAQVQRIVARVSGLRGTLADAEPDAVRTALLDARAEVLALLEPWLAETAASDDQDASAVAEEPPAEEDGTGDETSAPTAGTDGAEPVASSDPSLTAPTTDQHASTEPSEPEPSTDAPEPTDTEADPATTSEDDAVATAPTGTEPATDEGSAEAPDEQVDGETPSTP